MTQTSDDDQGIQLANLGLSSGSVMTRGQILWASLKNLFTGRGVYLSTNIKATFAMPAMSVSQWVKQPGSNTKWEKWVVVFGGDTEAQAFVDGKLVVKNEHTEPQL